MKEKTRKGLYNGKPQAYRTGAAVQPLNHPSQHLSIYLVGPLRQVGHLFA
jgi:hypothetical protein